MVVFNAAVGISIALWAQTIYELSILAWSLLLVGLFVPFAFGMYWKKANSWGAVAAFVGGFITWAVAIYYFFNVGIGGQSTAAVCELAADPGIYSEGWWCCTLGCSLYRLICGILYIHAADDRGISGKPESQPAESTCRLLW